MMFIPLLLQWEEVYLQRDYQILNIFGLFWPARFKILTLTCFGYSSFFLSRGSFLLLVHTLCWDDEGYNKFGKLFGSEGFTNLCL